MIKRKWIGKPKIINGKPVCKITGVVGTYLIIGAVQKALRDNDMEKQALEFTQKICGSSYSEMILLCSEYVSIY
jgi:hypothetical protein